MNHKKLKMIQGQMEQELDSALNYITLALELKDSDKSFADAYYIMATQDVAHMNVLNGLATQTIKELGEKGSPDYDKMRVIYTFLRDSLLEKSTEVNVLLSEYKK